jgi:hypothetical protein
MIETALNCLDLIFHLIKGFIEVVDGFSIGDRDPESLNPQLISSKTSPALPSTLLVLDANYIQR